MACFSAEIGARTADAIYQGGEVVTLDDRRPSAEALAVQVGRILAVGTNAEVRKLPGSTRPWWSTCAVARCWKA